MHASIPTTYISLVFCMFFLFFLSNFSSFLSSPISLFTTTPFYTICHGEIYHFCPSTTLAPYGCPSKIAHWPVGCRATTSTQNVLVAPLSIPRQNCLFCFLPLFVFTSLIQIKIKFSHHLPL